MTHRTFNAARLRELANNTGRVAVSVADSRPFSRNLAKVVLSATVPLAKTTQAELATAIARTLPGFTPVLGSFRELVGARAPSMVGFVARNTEVITPSDERYKRMRPVTASLMLDTGDSTMWDVCTGSEGTFLVRAGQEEDMAKVLVTASVRDVNAPKLRQIASCTSADSFVAYVNPNSCELAHGFVLAADGEAVNVLDSETGEQTIVPEDSVVEAASLNGDDVQVAETVGLDSKSFDARDKSSMESYYTQLYGYAPAYVEQLKQQINSHAAV